MRLKWKLISVHLEIVLILTEDRCTVCAECTIGSEIVLDVPLHQWHSMSLVLPVGATEEALAIGFWIVFAAE
jgi:hypothetical protein